MDRIEFEKYHTYKKIIVHRKKCDKWNKSFCLNCFGGGLYLFTKDLEFEKKVKS